MLHRLLTIALLLLLNYSSDGQNIKQGEFNIQAVIISGDNPLFEEMAKEMMTEEMSQVPGHIQFNDTYLANIFFEKDSTTVKARIVHDRKQQKTYLFREDNKSVVDLNVAYEDACKAAMRGTGSPKKDAKPYFDTSFGILCEKYEQELSNGDVEQAIITRDLDIPVCLMPSIIINDEQSIVLRAESSMEGAKLVIEVKNFKQDVSNSEWFSTDFNGYKDLSKKYEEVGANQVLLSQVDSFFEKTYLASQVDKWKFSKVNIDKMVLLNAIRACNYNIENDPALAIKLLRDHSFLPDKSIKIIEKKASGEQEFNSKQFWQIINQAGIKEFLSIKENRKTIVENHRLLKVDTAEDDKYGFQFINGEIDYSEYLCSFEFLEPLSMPKITEKDSLLSLINGFTRLLIPADIINDVYWVEGTDVIKIGTPNRDYSIKPKDIWKFDRKSRKYDDTLVVKPYTYESYLFPIVNQIAKDYNINKDIGLVPLSTFQAMQHFRIVAENINIQDYWNNNKVFKYSYALSLIASDKLSEYEFSGIPLSFHVKTFENDVQLYTPNYFTTKFLKSNQDLLSSNEKERIIKYHQSRVDIEKNKYLKKEDFLDVYESLMITNFHIGDENIIYNLYDLFFHAYYNDEDHNFFSVDSPLGKKKSLDLKDVSPLYYELFGEQINPRFTYAGNGKIHFSYAEKEFKANIGYSNTIVEEIAKLLYQYDLPKKLYSAMNSDIRYILLSDEEREEFEDIFKFRLTLVK